MELSQVLPVPDLNACRSELAGCATLGYDLRLAWRDAEEQRAAVIGPLRRAITGNAKRLHRSSVRRRVVRQLARRLRQAAPGDDRVRRVDERGVDVAAQGGEIVGFSAPLQSSV